LENVEIKKSADEVLADTNIEQEFAAVYLGIDEVAVYMKSGEVTTYDIFREPGYHPVPASYAKVYSTKIMYVVSNVDPTAECGGNNGINCLNSLSNVVLKGPKIFESSYEYSYSLNFNDPSNYKDYYEATTPKGDTGFNAYMITYNDRVRDVLRASNDIDPTPWLSGEKTDSDIEPEWKSKLDNNPKMLPYKDTVTIHSFAVRYFKPVKVAADDPAQQNQILEDQNFERLIERRDKFCGEFPAGSDLREQCYNTFVCLEVKCTAIVNNTIWSSSIDTLVPTQTPAEIVPTVIP